MAETVEAEPLLPLQTKRRKSMGIAPITELLEQLGARRQCVGLLRGKTWSLLRPLARGTPRGSRRRYRPRRRGRIPDGLLVAYVAALDGLSTLVSDWLAAWVLAAAWIVVGASLVLVLRGSAGICHRPGVVASIQRGGEEKRAVLEQARDDAAQAVRDSLGQLAPALSMEIASAAIGVADDVATEGGSTQAWTSSTTPTTWSRR